MSATKGQWKVDQTFSTHNAPVRSWETYVTSPSGTVAKACGETQEEAEANARQIAAAPELLEALRWTLEWIDAVPSDTVLPAMPGFDRDEVNRILIKAGVRP